MSEVYGQATVETNHIADAPLEYSKFPLRIKAGSLFDDEQFISDNSDNVIIKIEKHTTEEPWYQFSTSHNLQLQ